MSLKRTKRWLVAGFLLMVVGFAGAVGTLLFFGFHDQLGKADVGMVPGNAVDRWGTPSHRLRARLDRAAELYREGYFPKIIVSGGTGGAGFPEGTAMRTYLMKIGVPEGAIIVDNLGHDTYASAVNTKKILQEQGLRSVLVVSQYYHMSRCRLALSKVGVEKVYSAHAHYFEERDVFSTLRELPAYLKYLMLPQAASRATGAPRAGQ